MRDAGACDDASQDLDNQPKRVAFSTTNRQQRARVDLRWVGDRSPLAVDRDSDRQWLPEFRGLGDIGARASRRGKVDDDTLAVTPGCGEGEWIGPEHGLDPTVWGDLRKGVVEQDR